MKFRFLALGLMATLAGLASAHVFMPEKARALPHSTQQLQPQSTTVVSNVPAPTALNTVALDAGRAPVPVLLAHRRAFVPAVETVGASSPSDADMAPPGTMTETAAKASIEADGYKGVRALTRGPDGAWKAIALRGQTEVSLRVDPTGSVSAN